MSAAHSFRFIKVYESNRPVTLPATAARTSSAMASASFFELDLSRSQRIIVSLVRRLGHHSETDVRHRRIYEPLCASSMISCTLSPYADFVADLLVGGLSAQLLQQPASNANHLLDRRRFGHRGSGLVPGPAVGKRGSLRSAWSSISPTRSAVMPKSFPTLSRVLASPSIRPKRN